MGKQTPAQTSVAQSRTTSAPVVALKSFSGKEKKKKIREATEEWGEGRGPVRVRGQGGLKIEASVSECANACVRVCMCVCARVFDCLQWEEIKPESQK